MLANIFKKPEVLNKDIHKDIKISSYEDYKFTEDAFLVPIGLDEIQVAMKSLIVVFVKELNGDMFPAVVLGGENGKNLLLNKDNQWKKHTYIPAALRCYPFGIGENKENKFITIDASAEIFKNKNGKRIFDDNKTATKDGEFSFKFVQDVYSNIENSKKFTKEIDAYGILKQANLEISIQDEKYTLTKGIYIIDESLFQKLESRKIKKLATKGSIGYIYAHLFSLSNKY